MAAHLRHEEEIGDKPMVNNKNTMPPVKKPKATPTPSCDVTITVTTPFSITVPLTKNDIMNWMNNCNDKETLLNLERYARYCAASVQAAETDNDDFRSRA